MKTIKLEDGRKVNVFTSTEHNSVISPNDIEMDKRAKQAVRAAIEKAKFCKKPIAMYDKVLKKAYIQYADGVKKYVE